MRNLRLDLCYDGTRYKGWQRLSQSDQTIQSKLENALSRILEEPVEVSGSGRTDAGTHALRQVANFHCSNPMQSDEILMQLRRYLPEDIGIYSCREVSQRFHARLNAKTKTYCYRIWNSEAPCVFERKYVHLERRPLNIDKMREAAADFLGTHDFSAFCANKNFKKSTIRAIMSFDIVESENEVRFLVTGNGFLHHMVRIMVGTLVEIGLGERPVTSVSQLYGKERANAGITMPACGLCLMEVNY